MPRLVPSLVFVLAVMVAGGATARLVDREGSGLGPAAVQQAQVQQQPSPVRDTLEKAKDSGMERVRANVPLPPELKALRDEIKEQVGDLRATVNKKYEEAGAKAAAYALWAAVGLFVIMVLASVLGGVIVALIFRRNRNA
jgi:hypothetical protein